MVNLSPFFMITLSYFLGILICWKNDIRFSIVFGIALAIASLWATLYFERASKKKENEKSKR